MLKWDDEARRAVLAYWFEEVGPQGWFGGGPAVDAEVRRRFLPLFGAVVGSDDAALLGSPEEALAAIVILDQFTRNMFRGQGRAFDVDYRCAGLARAAVARGYDQTVTVARRIFFYLPLEHAEDLASQDLAVQLITALGDVNFTDYAERHRDVIRKFGRFPHRNAALGRLSTAAERAYLAEPGSGF